MAPSQLQTKHQRKLGFPIRKALQSSKQAAKLIKRCENDAPDGILSPAKRLNLRNTNVPVLSPITNSPKFTDHRGREGTTALPVGSKRRISFDEKFKAKKLKADHPEPAKEGGNDNASSELPNQTTPTKESYQLARQSLQSTDEYTIVGRGEQMDSLKQFLTANFALKRGGSLYVCGPPGTGKTVTVMHILNQFKVTHKYEQVVINCVCVNTNVGGIYTKVLAELGVHCGKKESFASKLEKTVTAKGPSLVVVLDELDQLSASTQQVLYTLFEWCALPKSRLILVGIANSFDLTDRLLPRLHTLSPKVRPAVMRFPAYDHEQLIEILTCRLNKNSTVVKPMAVQFCARKVASGLQGDARKAISLCRRALEIAEHGNGKTQEGCVDLPHVMAALEEQQQNGVLRQDGSGGNGATLTMQQKLLLTAFLVVTKRAKTKQVSAGQVHDAYVKVSDKHGVTTLDQGEFNSLCQLIESRGIIAFKKNKDPRFVKVSLKALESDVRRMLGDNKLLSSYLTANGI